MMKIIEIQTAFPDFESAAKALKELVMKRLIACGNIMPAQSIYMWEGKYIQESESIVMMKTSTENIDLVTNEIRKVHPYEVPALLTWPIDANDEYAMWVNETTQNKNRSI